MCKGWIIGFLVLIACSPSQKEPLPVIGPYEKREGEKHFRPVPPFSLLNQHGQPVSDTNLREQVQIIDFFFTSCPGICPQVQQQMLRIHQAFASAPNVSLISFTLDPKRDTPQRLAEYATGLGITAPPNWQFLTGDRKELFRLAEEYFNIVTLDESAPGGIDHTGRIILVDTKGFIRAWANGLDTEDVDRFIQDIHILLTTS